MPPSRGQPKVAAAPPQRSSQPQPEAKEGAASAVATFSAAGAAGGLKAASTARGLWNKASAKVATVRQLLATKHAEVRVREINKRGRIKFDPETHIAQICSPVHFTQRKYPADEPTAGLVNLSDIGPSLEDLIQLAETYSVYVECTHLRPAPRSRGEDVDEWVEKLSKSKVEAVTSALSKRGVPQAQCVANIKDSPQEAFRVRFIFGELQQHVKDKLKDRIQKILERGHLEMDWAKETIDVKGAFKYKARQYSKKQVDPPVAEFENEGLAASATNDLFEMYQLFCVQLEVVRPFKIYHGRLACDPDTVWARQLAENRAQCFADALQSVTGGKDRMRVTSLIQMTEGKPGDMHVRFHFGIALELIDEALLLERGIFIHEKETMFMLLYPDHLEYYIGKELSLVNALTMRNISLSHIESIEVLEKGFQLRLKSGVVLVFESVSMDKAGPFASALVEAIGKQKGYMLPGSKATNNGVLHTWIPMSVPEGGTDFVSRGSDDDVWIPIPGPDGSIRFVSKASIGDAGIQMLGPDGSIRFANGAAVGEAGIPMTGPDGSLRFASGAAIGDIVDLGGWTEEKHLIPLDMFLSAEKKSNVSTQIQAITRSQRIKFDQSSGIATVLVDIGWTPKKYGKDVAHGEISSPGRLKDLMQDIKGLVDLFVVQAEVVYRYSLHSAAGRMLALERARSFITALETSFKAFEVPAGDVFRPGVEEHANEEITLQFDCGSASAKEQVRQAIDEINRRGQIDCDLAQNRITIKAPIAFRPASADILDLVGCQPVLKDVAAVFELFTVRVQVVRHFKKVDDEIHNEWLQALTLSEADSFESLLQDAGILESRLSRSKTVQEANPDFRGPDLFVRLYCNGQSNHDGVDYHPLIADCLSDDQWKALKTVGPFNRRTEVLTMKIDWHDQGWGRRKGCVRAVLRRDGKDIGETDCFGLAPHAPKKMARQLRTVDGHQMEPQDVLNFEYCVGGGGGHELYIKRFVAEYDDKSEKDVPMARKRIMPRKTDPELQRKARGGLCWGVFSLTITCSRIEELPVRAFVILHDDRLVASPVQSKDDTQTKPEVSYPTRDFQDVEVLDSGMVITMRNNVALKLERDPRQSSEDWQNILKQWHVQFEKVHCPRDGRTIKRLSMNSFELERKSIERAWSGSQLSDPPDGWDGKTQDKLREIWNLCDKDTSGRMTRAALLDVCSQSPLIAEFFGVKGKTTRSVREMQISALDGILHSLEVSALGGLTWQEFRNSYVPWVPGLLLQGTVGLTRGGGASSRPHFLRIFTDRLEYLADFGAGHGTNCQNFIRIDSQNVKQVRLRDGGFIVFLHNEPDFKTLEIKIFADDSMDLWLTAFSQLLGDTPTSQTPPQSPITRERDSWCFQTLQQGERKRGPRSGSQRLSESPTSGGQRLSESQEVVRFQPPAWLLKEMGSASMKSCLAAMWPQPRCHGLLWMREKVASSFIARFCMLHADTFAAFDHPMDAAHRVKPPLQVQISQVRGLECFGMGFILHHRAGNPVSVNSGSSSELRRWLEALLPLVPVVASMDVRHDKLLEESREVRRQSARNGSRQRQPSQLVQTPPGRPRQASAVSAKKMSRASSTHRKVFASAPGCIHVSFNPVLCRATLRTDLAFRPHAYRERADKSHVEFQHPEIAQATLAEIAMLHRQHGGKLAVIGVSEGGGRAVDSAYREVMLNRADKICFALVNLGSSYGSVSATVRSGREDEVGRFIFQFDGPSPQANAKARSSRLAASP